MEERDLAKDKYFERIREENIEDPYIPAIFVTMRGVLNDRSGQRWVFLITYPGPYLYSPAADISVNCDVLVVRPRVALTFDPPPARLPENSVLGMPWDSWIKENNIRVPDDWSKPSDESYVAFPIPPFPERVEIAP